MLDQTLPSANRSSSIFMFSNVECYYLYAYLCFFYILCTVELIHYIFLSFILDKNITMNFKTLCDKKKKR